MTERRRPRGRLYLRIYLALLASLLTATILFGMAHMHYGAVPGSLFHLRGHPAMLAVLGLIAVIVAAASYPVVRRLTARLERLQAGVDAWGTGDLSARVAVEGSDEIAELAASFNHSAARIEALVQAQKTLLANASHELRSPLARIRMAVELLQDRAPDSLRAELALNIAELDQLIGELLLASRLDATAGERPPAEPVDLAALVAEECARADADCAAEPVELGGEAALLRRMVRNLLENARRHGGGAVALRLERRPESDIVLEVADDGPGIPESEREAIFAPFHRLTGASEAEGGVGLGLSLVRQIARRHGGEVSCHDRPGGGSLFRVTLPSGGSGR